MTIDNNHKITVLIVLLAFFVTYEAKQSFDKLKGNVHRLLMTTEEGRRGEMLAYMGYKFVGEIVNPIEDKRLMPHLQYISHDYGVRVFLNGMRNNIVKDFVIVIGLDNVFKDIKCDKRLFDESIQLECRMPKGVYHVTGVKFESEVGKDKTYNIEYASNDNRLISHDFSSNNVFHTKKVPGRLGIPSRKDGYYETISNSDIESDSLVVTIKGDVESIPNFSLTGHVKNIGDHYILKWDQDDARSYFAILKNMVDTNGNITDPRLEKAIREIMGGL